METVAFFLLPSSRLAFQTYTGTARIGVPLTDNQNAGMFQSHDNGLYVILQSAHCSL